VLKSLSEDLKDMLFWKRQKEEAFEKPVIFKSIIKSSIAKPMEYKASSVSEIKPAKEISSVDFKVKDISLVEQGITLVIVEHKLRELMRLVNRVIVLHYGKMIADGTPKDISKDEHVLKAYLGKRWVEFHA
jgi:ABC-type uncharacterized transport system ATPase subunit